LSGLGTEVIDEVASRISRDISVSALTRIPFSTSEHRVTSSCIFSISAASSSDISSSSFFFFFLSAALGSSLGAMAGRFGESCVGPPW